jgi:hypothetical protein
MQPMSNAAGRIDTVTATASRFLIQSDRSPMTPPLLELEDDSSCDLTFSIMPGRTVSEVLHPVHYRLWPRFIECRFDRTYRSEMKKSPSHLIFMTALLHLQRMTYLSLCQEFGLPVTLVGAERIKLWPTRITTSMPKLARAEQNLFQRVAVEGLEELAPGKYSVEVRSRAGGAVDIEGEAVVFRV